MPISQKHSEYLRDYQRLQGKYFELNRNAERTEGEEAKKKIEAKLIEHHDALNNLSVVSTGHPLTTTIEGCTEFIALQYSDGTLSAQVREKNGNTKQLVVWGSKGPENIKMQVYYVDNAKSGAQQAAVLTGSNQVIGECTRDNKSLGTYQIDLQ